MSCEVETALRHKHHITPKYMGGSDEPGNLIEVTITQHSMWHFCNYQLWGNWEDYLAYKALSGQIKGQDVIKYKLKMGGKKGGKILSEKMKDKKFREKYIQTLKSKWEVSKYKEKNLALLRSIQPLAWKMSKTPESINKKKETLKRIQHQQGEKNSQFGTRWIHNLELKVSRRIKKDAIIPDGWLEGRVINFDKKLSQPINTIDSKKEKSLGLKRNWEHEKYGTVLGCTSTELSIKFEFMNLNKGALSQVALGRNSHHKGWRIVCDDLNEVPKINRKKAKKHLWYNKNLGITLELSVRELAEKFSGEKLYLSHLYKVASGKKTSYKGWSVV